MDTKRAIALGSLLAVVATGGAAVAADQKPATGQAPAASNATAQSPDQGTPATPSKKHKKKHTNSSSNAAPTTDQKSKEQQK
jgi:hypothetical protein